MIAQKLLELSLLVAFLGWLLVWVMIPTETYKYSWTPRLKEDLNSSTYFQTQGTNLLLLSSPVLFIATFGCIYLHLKKKWSNKCSNNNKSSSSCVIGALERLAILKRPVIVATPIGIVTVTELMFATMFVGLMVWSMYNYLHVSFTHPYMHGTPMAPWLTKLRSVALRLGYIGNTCWAFLFFPVTRGSSVLPLVGLTSEKSIKYHIWLGHLSMVLFVAHTLGFIIVWAVTHQMAEMLDWSKTYVSNVAGEIAIVFAVIMWVTSMSYFRRKKFEVFFYFHHLYILYIIFYVLHVGAAYFCMILPGIFLFLVDRHLRFLQSRQRARLISARVLPSNTIELNFSKSPGLIYNPGSILFLNVPSISKLQCHPYTITSNCNMEPDRISVVIRGVGSWSEKLLRQVSKSPDRIEVSVEGPYGPTSSDFLKHKKLVMVGGGSGVTPFFSIIREIIFQANDGGRRPPPQVLLICAFKTVADLAMLDLLLPPSSGIGLHGLDQVITDLRIEAYVTREQAQPEHNIGEAQTLAFKPDPSDWPVSSSLGPCSWLWLGSIIVTSFIMFLIILGLVSRFYIGPDNPSYHFSYWALWDMFLVCACIGMVSSVGFLLMKKWQREFEGKAGTKLSIHPHDLEDRELESLPLQSISQATKVHYGARPDLAKIINEYCGEEEDSGVMVCGPRKMRHQVAKICASVSSNNLHFEPISFSW